MYFASRSRIRNRERLEDAAHREVAGLLGDPGAGRVRRDAGEVDAPRAELDEEQHVDAPQQDRVDAEEVAGDDAGWPARAGTGARSGRRVAAPASDRAASRTRRTVLGETLIAELRAARRRSAGSPSAGSRARGAGSARASPGRSAAGRAAVRDGASGAGRGRGASEAASRASRSGRRDARGGSSRASAASSARSAHASRGRGGRPPQHRELMAEDQHLGVASDVTRGADRAAVASRRRRGRGSEAPSRHRAGHRTNRAADRAPNIGTLHVWGEPVSAFLMRDARGRLCPPVPGLRVAQT